MNQARLGAVPRTLALLLAVALFGCVALAAALALAQAPRFATRHETLEHALERRGIAFREVYYEQSWPMAVNYYAYGSQVYPYIADVTVRLSDGGSVSGQLSCRDDRRLCDLDVPRLGIRSERLPEVAERRAWPWEAWIAGVVARLH